LLVAAGRVDESVFQFVAPPDPVVPAIVELVF
jgi:hypothetical protein